MLRDQQEPQYVRLRLDFADGDRLAYINPRRIGHVVLVQSSGAFIADTGLGPDALGPAFDEAAFSATLGNRKQAVKAILMDQTRIAGIGNIYADEILFQAKLHPAVVARTLDRAARGPLFTAMKSVLQTAIDCGAGAEILTDRLPKTLLLHERHVGGQRPRCGSAIEATNAAAARAIIARNVSQNQPPDCGAWRSTRADTLLPASRAVRPARQRPCAARCVFGMLVREPGLCSR